MTNAELRDKLNHLSDSGYAAFLDKFGGGYRTRDELVREYADSHQHEGRLCYLLNVATEEEKTVKAALESTSAAKASASSAKRSEVIAAIAAAIALIALLVTIYGLHK